MITDIVLFISETTDDALHVKCCLLIGLIKPPNHITEIRWQDAQNERDEFWKDFSLAQRWFYQKCLSISFGCLVWSTKYDNILTQLLVNVICISVVI